MTLFAAWVLWLGMQEQAHKPWDADVYRDCQTYQMINERGNGKTEEIPMTVCHHEGMQGQAGGALELSDLCMYLDGWKPCGQIHATPRHFQMNGNMVCDQYPDEQRLVCYADPVPAEHVFEIRTKRETHGWSGYPIACDEGTEAEQVDTGTTDLWFRCVRLTRELWLDGHRLGIILGLQ